MEIFHSDKHLLHQPEAELHRGQLVSPHEGAHRMEMLLAGLKKAGFDTYRTPTERDIAHIEAVHSPAYLDFLQNAWKRWQDAGYASDVLPMSYPHRPRRSNPPADIDGAAGYFCFSSDCVITETTWQAIKAGADCALAAADAVSRKGSSAFVLTRPPGHHAGRDYMGGYCYLNYAAIAAQRMRKQGAGRVTILDVDFHHGNGTQDIFYARGDVFFASIHGEPDHHFPYFWGHVDETGQGDGEGFNANYPLAAGSDYGVWRQAFDDATKQITEYGADALIVSLGVDTFEEDPISSFKLKMGDYADYGRAIGALNLPTIFIMEGGYGVPEIGDNVAGVLTGFLDA